MKGMVMVECPRHCGWVEPVGSLFALGPTLTQARADELRAQHDESCELVDPDQPLTAAMAADLLERWQQ